MHAMTDKAIAEARGPNANGRWDLRTHANRSNATATIETELLAAPRRTLALADPPEAGWEFVPECDCIWPCDRCLLQVVGNG